MTSHDQYLIWDIEDPLHASLCGGDDVQEIISQFQDRSKLCVRRVTLDHFSRNIPLDEFEDEQPVFVPAWDREASAADRRYQENREGV